VPIPPIQISDDDALYRRLSISGHLKPDGSVSSNSYKLYGKPDPEPSVDLARLSTIEVSLARVGRPGFCLGELKAGDVRALGLTVTHEPIDENPSHSCIRGNATKTTCTQLADITRRL
jgi:hypothetical protein